MSRELAQDPSTCDLNEPYAQSPLQGTGHSWGRLYLHSVPTLPAGIQELTTASPPPDEGTDVMEDSNGKTFTVTSRVEFHVTKEDNDMEVTCTVDHESLQNTERSVTQKLQVYCTCGGWPEIQPGPCWARVVEGCKQTPPPLPPPPKQSTHAAWG